MFFAGLAATGAIGAYFANRRSANSAEEQVALLRSQVDDAKADATEQRRIAIEALAETRRSADAAKEGADAAKRGADVAEQTLRIAERAYLTFIEWKITFPEGAPPVATYSIINKGRTPATLLDSGYAMKVTSEDRLPETPKYTTPFKDEGRMLLTEGVPFRRRMNLKDAADEDIVAIRETHSKTLWFWGFIRYLDAFGAPHVTRFLVTYEHGQGLVVDPRMPGYNHAD